MARERILITVKTYPTLSSKYGETVCTAGVRPDGTWVRIYPVPFRRLDETEQYKKYDWLECSLTRNSSDPRPETYRPEDARQLVPVGHMDTAQNWRERRELLLGKAAVYTKLEALINAAKANTASLAVFKPTRLLSFKWESEAPEWDADKLAQIRAKAQQRELFAEDVWHKTFQIIPKLPYSFSYRFEDDAGKQSELQILDWEIGALFWNCLRSHGTEELALQKVRQKYFEQFGASDLHFFMGTTQEFHFRAPNPWVIIGVFPIPPEKQISLI